MVIVFKKICWSPHFGNQRFSDSTVRYWCFPLRDICRPNRYFSFVLRLLGWNELKIYSNFTKEYRYARKKLRSGNPTLRPGSMASPSSPGSRYEISRTWRTKQWFGLKHFCKFVYVVWTDMFISQNLWIFFELDGKQYFKIFNLLSWIAC